MTETPAAGSPEPDDGGLLRAVKLTAPVATAYVPLGRALGVLVVKNGLDWFWAPLSAVFIYAGSMEFLAVGLIANAVPAVQVALVTLVVNFRHLFYGLSFPMHRLRTPLQRFYGIWSLTDEAYVITATGPGAELSGRQITVLQAVCQFWWAGSALVGALVGQLIPDSVVGFGFALTAMFVTLFVDSLRQNVVVANLLAAGLAILLAFLAERLWPGSFLIVGLLAYLACVTVRYLRAAPAQRAVLR